MDIIEKTFKYICNQCKFNCNEQSRWLIHINSEKHKTGKRKKRSDYKETRNCDKCEYETRNETLLKQHILNEHSNKKERLEGFKYYCKKCDMGTFSNAIYEKHIKTEKHIKCEMRGEI